MRGLREREENSDGRGGPLVPKENRGTVCARFMVTIRWYESMERKTCLRHG